MEEPIRFFEPTRSAPTCYIPIDAVWRKDVPFGELIDTSPNHGSNPSKTPQSGQELTFPALIFFIFPDQNDVRSRTVNSSKRPSRRDAQCARFNIRVRVISGFKLAIKPFQKGNPSQT
jgi:hypothetical protein